MEVPLTGRAYARYGEVVSVKPTDDKAAKSRKGSKSAEERNRAWVQRALREGFRPMTVEDLRRLAVGTPGEGEALRRAAAELKGIGKKKRKGA
jgi:hypothetical protein